MPKDDKNPNFTHTITRKNNGEVRSLEEKYETAIKFPTEEKGRFIKIEDIKQMFVADTSLTLEALSDKFSIPITDLRVVCNSQDWYKLRANMHKMTRGQAQKVMTEQLKDILEVNLNIQQLKTIQLMQQVAHIQNHLAIYGDLWLRDPDNPGQILKDSNGMPRKMPIPREVADIQAMIELTQGVNSLITERDAGNETPLLSGRGDIIEPEFKEVFGSDEDS